MLSILTSLLQSPAFKPSLALAGCLVLKIGVKQRLKNSSRTVRVPSASARIQSGAGKEECESERGGGVDQGLEGTEHHAGGGGSTGDGLPSQNQSPIVTADPRHVIVGDLATSRWRGWAEKEREAKV